MKISFVPWIALFAVTGAFAQSAEDTRLKVAAEVVKEVMSIKEKAIPQELLEKAECAVIVPGLKKGAFIVGAKFGRGYFTCRQNDKVGWKSPAAIRIEGGSLGFQIGGAEMDVILLVMNKRGAERLLSSKFTMGGEASVAAGPVGRDSSAQTDGKLTAEILSYSRQRGVFAGISLQGATLREDMEANKALYGQRLTSKEVFEKNPAAPAAAAELLQELNRYSSRK
ncbi:MAG: lipid-binding SYLF domain-containing protein [Bryobacteraceae bacterium]|nr:lipid-binding SYLF domain-containing protein [Bryobacteraceae bacterium]